MIRRSHHSPFGRASAFVICLSLGVLGARSGFGQGLDERAAARAAADQGLAAFQAGQWEQAADLFGRAESLVHSMMHLLYLSRCQARLGKLVEAEDNYLKVLREPLASGAPAGFRRAQALATVELRSLKPTIPRVTILVPPGASENGFRVLLDDRPLPDAMVGLPVPVNPGEHVWLLQGPDGQSTAVAKRLEEGSSETVQLEMPPVAAVQAEPLAVEASEGSLSQPAGDPMELSVGSAGLSKSLLSADASTPSTRSDWPLYSAVGLAAVGAGLGVVYRLKYDSQVRLLNERCPGKECDRTEENRIAIQKEELFGTLSYVGFGASLVGVGATALFLFLAEEGPPAGDSAATVWWGVTGSSAFVRGRF